MSEIVSTRAWFDETEQIPLGAPPNVRQLGFYIGMQCEELAEKLATVLGPEHSVVVDLGAVGEAFKSQRKADDVSAALCDPERAKDMLDGDADLIWVTIGASAAAGFNLDGAYNRGVSAANWAKKFPDGTFHRHAVTGKVLKPEGWKAPDLTPFLHPSTK